MNHGEASRQHQIALEHRRAVINVFGDVISAEDEVNEAKIDAALAEQAMKDTWDKTPEGQKALADLEEMIR
jgi:predicted AAA+ superfamily ATPase